MNRLTTKSRAILAVTVVFCLVSSYSISRADQNDPDLNELFAQLQSSSRTEAERLEDRIWESWVNHQDDAVTELMDKGKELLNRREYTEAAKVFTEVTEKAPDFAEGWNKLATVNYLLDDHVSSVRYIHKTLSLEPRHFGALSGMGLIFLAKGDLRAAHAAFQEVLKISPSSQSARYYTDQIEDFLGDPA